VTIVALLDPNPGDATLTDVGYQANHVAVLEETHGRQRPHPLPDLALQKRPAGGQPGQADVGPAQPLTRQLPPDGAQRVPDLGTGLPDLFGESGEELVEHLPAPGVQAMEVKALRHPRRWPMSSGSSSRSITVTRV
jgi:hypothetical protein